MCVMALNMTVWELTGPTDVLLRWEAENWASILCLAVASAVVDDSVPEYCYRERFRG